MEVIDLAEELSPVPYSKIAPREYHKLHNLYASVQKDNSGSLVRLPKQKPQFVYASGYQPDLSFLRKTDPENDDEILCSGESDGEEVFPSPSALAAYLKGDSDDPFESGYIHTSSIQDPSLESLEAGMLGLDEPMPFGPPTPRANSSFANGVFDFDAFNEKYAEPEVYSSPLMRDSRKRDRSRSPALPETKHRRFSQEEPETSPKTRSSGQQEISAPSDISIVESRRIKIQDLIEENSQQNAQRSTQQHSVPAWVDDFDTDLIESLRGIVDFVE